MVYLMETYPFCSSAITHSQVCPISAHDKKFSTSYPPKRHRKAHLPFAQMNFCPSQSKILFFGTAKSLLCILRLCAMRSTEQLLEIGRKQKKLGIFPKSHAKVRGKGKILKILNFSNLGRRSIGTKDWEASPRTL